METNDLTGLVIKLCIDIHKKIGPGCYERVYEEILYFELIKMGLNVQRQVLMPIAWEELEIPNAFKLDLLVDNKLIIELKSVYPLPIVYFKQIKTHLSLMNLKYGMIVNFKENLIKDGIHRVFNNGGRENIEDLD
jgi:GxxExxY protein